MKSINIKDCGIEDSSSFFLQEINFAILKQVVDWQLAKKRSGCHQTKNVSMVAGTTAKPHRQKGTGRARQGSRRSNQMRGGGVVFGPNIRDYSYSLSKKIRKLGLLNALSLLFSQNKLHVVDFSSVVASKLSVFHNEFETLCKTLNINHACKMLFVDDSEKLIFSTRNLRNIDLLPSIGLNVYDIISHDYIMISKDSFAKIVNFIKK